MGSPLELARKQTGLKGKIILQLLMKTAEKKAGGSFIAGREPPRCAITKEVSPGGILSMNVFDYVAFASHT